MKITYVNGLTNKKKSFKKKYLKSKKTSNPSLNFSNLLDLKKDQNKNLIICSKKQLRTHKERSIMVKLTQFMKFLIAKNNLAKF